MILKQNKSWLPTIVCGFIANFAICKMGKITASIFLVLALLISGKLNAQTGLTTFGITFKPMIAGSLINEGEETLREGSVEFSTPKLFGYNAGMVVRHNFTKLFALESGISFTQRNFDLIVKDASKDYTFSKQFGIVGYEIPVQGLVYVQLSKQIFMDVSFGFVADLYPSDVAVIDAEYNRVIMEGRRKEWIQGSLIANIGWEFRTKKSGAFYFGGTYHRSFSDSYGFLMEYDYEPDNLNSQSTKLLQIINGNYLTLDFRYFFHANVEKQKAKRNSRR